MSKLYESLGYREAMQRFCCTDDPLLAEHGAEFLRSKMAARNAQIVRAYMAGLTLEEAGKLFNLTRERVRQLVKKSAVGEVFMRRKR